MAVDLISAPAVANKQEWRAIIKKYEQRSNARAALQLATTWLPLAVLFAITYRVVQVSIVAGVVLALPAAGLLVRTFIIMHDCAHGSFFSSRRLNDAVGWLAGVMTLTPYAQWRRDHAMHHASAGDLERRGHGDVPTLTVREFEALSRVGRWRYRLLRNPIVLLAFGPLHLIFTQRVRPPGTPLADPQTRSVWSTNLAIVGLLALFVHLIGWRLVALTYVPAIYVAASAGIWLFFVQHQFDPTYWAAHADWDYFTAALCGSSYLRLPVALRWFTGDIGVHHVHHLSPRIPNYRLRRCHDENPMFHSVTVLTWRDGFRAFRLSLWDENESRLIGFADLDRALGHPPRV
jgi:omega-6 fatty acid desaturase (delta-12 desaturase)